MKFGISPRYDSGKVDKIPKNARKKKGMADGGGGDEDEAEPEDEEEDDEQPKKGGARKAAPAKKLASKRGKTKKSLLKDNPGDDTPSEEGARYRYIMDDPVPPGCTNEQERRALRNQLDSGRIDHSEWYRQFEELMSPIEKRKTPRRVLEVPLVHGSFVVMHGGRMQEVYQVSLKHPTASKQP